MKNMNKLFSGQKPLTTGQTIKAYREAFGFTQKRLAELMGISQTNLSVIERDKKELSIEVAKKFCTIFNITLKDLISPNDIESSPSKKNYDKLKIKKSR